MSTEVICPKCGEKMEKGKKNFQFGLIELYDTECMRCPKCGYEMYTKEQFKEVMDSINKIDLSFEGLY
ncbi:MAG: DUF7479 domain-containing protein [Candidatus Odinarchaeia archaeon]